MPVPAVGGAMNSIYKMRGRMPGGAGMPESTFKAFDTQSFGRFQRKNKKVTEFLLEGKSNPRYELMMKMVRIYEKYDQKYPMSKMAGLKLPIRTVTLNLIRGVLTKSGQVYGVESK